MSEVSENGEYSLANLEKLRDDGKKLIDTVQSLRRLEANPDFQKVILGSFCGTEALNYIQESADPLLTPPQRADALAIAQASGHLKRFLGLIHTKSAYFERTMPDIEEAIAEARSEEDGGPV